MPYRRRSGHKKFFAGFAKWLGIFALGVLAVLAVVAIILVVRSSMTKKAAFSQKAPIKLASVEIQEPDDASSEISGKYFGLCKKNSIHSVEDFRRTVRNDAVLSAHFSGFNWEAAKLGKQDKDIWTFVSYRKGEEIRRTSKPVRLPKDDGYITDGVNIVRTYCCNDYVIAPPPMALSMVPADPVGRERVDSASRRVAKDYQPENHQPENDPSRNLSPGPPDENSPVMIPESLSTGPGYSFLPHSGPGYLPYSSSKRGGTPLNHRPPTIVTPEPGTFLLVGTGVAVMGLFRLLRRRRTRLR